MSKSQKAQENCHTPEPPKHDDCDNCTATFTAIGNDEDSYFINTLLIPDGDGGTRTLAEENSSVRIDFDCETNDRFNLVSARESGVTDDDFVKIYADADGDGTYSAGDLLLTTTAIRDTDITLDLLRRLSMDGERDLILRFEDDRVGTGDEDYNDLVALVHIDCEDHEEHVKCNAGRGNGPELVNGVDCDPGNSGGHNNGGDYAGMPDHHGLLVA